MARRGDAPRALGKLSPRGVPTRAILTGTVLGYLAVVMNYYSPDRVFQFIVNSYGTVAIFVYVLIALAQLRLRRRLEREAPQGLKLKMWGFPYLTLLAIAAMVVIVAAMAFLPEQRLALWFGIASAALMALGYGLRRRDPI
jgi:GABA permease